MIISNWLLILALAAGSGANALSGSDSTEPDELKRRIRSDCYINGVWYNPCPESAPGEQPPPEILPPT